MKILGARPIKLNRLGFLAITVFLPLIAMAKHPDWTEVRSAHFLVVTDAGEKQAVEIATQFEQIRTFFRQSLSVASHHPSPFVKILALKDERTTRELFSQERENGVLGESQPFLDQNYTWVDLATQRSGHFAVFYHEYYHWITLPEFPDLPLWLTEGLADFYGHTDIGNDHVSTGLADRDRLNDLKGKRPIPLSVLFQVDQKSPYYNDPKKLDLFYAESWLLTHYLMLGNQEAHRGLVKYMEALGQGKSALDAIAAFGDLTTLQSNLERYRRQKTFLSLNAPLPKSESDDIKVRALSDTEVTAYLGGFSAAFGHTQQGTEILMNIIRRDPNSALAYEYLGAAQFSDRKTEKALESASRAIALDPNNPSARYLRAYIAINDRNSNDTHVEEDLRKTIAMSPEFSPAYALLGWYVASSASRVEEGLSLIKKALSFDPSNSSFYLRLAHVLQLMNKYDEALAAASRAEALARNAHEKSDAQEMKSYLERQKKNSSTPQS